MLALRRPCVLAALLQLVLAVPAEAAQVVVGVTPVDGASTTVVAIDLDGKEGSAPHTLGEVAHRRGHAPVGVIIDERTLGLVVEVGNASDGLLIARDLVTGAERSLLDEVVPTHAPLVWQRPDGGREVVAVRLRDETVKGGTFDIVGVDVLSGTSVVRASGRRLWVTPVQGPASGATTAPAFLVIDGATGFQGAGKTGDGHAHLDIVIDGTFVTQQRLGPGSFRSPVRVGDRVLVEAAVIPGQSARLVDVTSPDKPGVHSGRPGLSPAVSPAGVLVVSSSKKDGSVLIRRGETWGTLASGRAGIARPLLVVDEAGGVVVVAMLDRGLSFPAELWAIRASGAKALWPATARTALTVYGSLTALPSSPSPSPPAPAAPSPKAVR